MRFAALCVREAPRADTVLHPSALHRATTAQKTQKAPKGRLRPRTQLERDIAAAAEAGASQKRIAQQDQDALVAVGGGSDDEGDDGFLAERRLRRELLFRQERKGRRERRIKKWLRDWKLALIERDNPDWRDLAADWFPDPNWTPPPGAD